MYLERKQELSLYYWLDDLFSGSGVSVVDSYYDGDLEVPRIAIVGEEIASSLHELGGQERYERIWDIKIYAKTKQQRDEIGYKIFTKVREDGHIPVQDYDEGFPPEVSPSNLGFMDVLEHQYLPRNFDSELQASLEYRATVAIHVRYIV